MIENNFFLMKIEQSRSLLYIFHRDPTPKSDMFLRGLKWPASGAEGKYLEIGDRIIPRAVRPISLFVKFLERIQLSQFYYFNDCPSRVATTVSVLMQETLQTMKDIAEIPLDLVENSSNFLQNTFVKVRDTYKELTDIPSPYPKPQILPGMQYCISCSSIYVPSVYK